MKKKITKVIVEGKTLYIKNFRVVHPIKNEDGSINWFNLFTGGSWNNLIIIGAIIFILLGLLHEYSTNIDRLLEELGKCWCLDSPLV